MFGLFGYIKHMHGFTFDAVATLVPGEISEHPTHRFPMHDGSYQIIAWDSHHPERWASEENWKHFSNDLAVYGPFTI